jgi:hypothetical protein
VQENARPTHRRNMHFEKPKRQPDEMKNYTNDRSEKDELRIENPHSLITARGGNKAGTELAGGGF